MKNQLTSEDHVKILETLLSIINKDNSGDPREVFRAKLTYYIKGCLLQTETLEKK